jgi:HEAT repeat protein
MATPPSATNENGIGGEVVCLDRAGPCEVREERPLRTLHRIVALALTASPVAASTAIVTPVARAETPSKFRTPDQQRESLVMLLAAYEPVMKRSVFDSVGPDVPRLLIDIASHPKEAPTVRQRAVSALALYPSAATRGFLLSLLNDRNLLATTYGLVVKAQALRSLGRAFGDTEVDTLASYRSDPEVQIRAGAAYGLGDSKSKKARLVLETWLAQEDNLTVKHAIDRALTALRGF